MNPQKYEKRPQIEMIPHVVKPEQELIELEPQDLLKLPSIFQDAYHKANKIRRGNRIDMSKFGYVDYEDDMAMLSGLMSKIKIRNDEAKKTPSGVKVLAEGVILESLVQDVVNNLKLFGKNTRSRRSSLYDDVVNGADIILEHRNDDYVAHAAISLDVTYGEYAFDKKVSALKEELKNDKLGEIKYYESVDGNTKSRLFAAPKLIIGIPEALLGLNVRDWIDNNKNGNLNRFASTVIDLMIAECDQFSLIGSTKIKEVYEREARILRSIRKELKVL